MTITSPRENEQKVVGSLINVTGTSTPANATSHCVVSIIVNGIRPYQNTLATGANGTKDYSSWKFIDKPNYATVKVGQNKITTKYSCFPNSDPSNTQPRFVKFHSVNVTGVLAQQQQQQTSLLSTTPAHSGNSSIARNPGGAIINEPTHSRIIN